MLTRKLQQTGDMLGGSIDGKVYGTLCVSPDKNLVRVQLKDGEFLEVSETDRIEIITYAEGGVRKTTIISRQQALETSEAGSERSLYAGLDCYIEKKN